MINQNLPILLTQSLNIKGAAVIHPAEHNPILITEHSDLALQIQKVQPGECHPADASPLMLVASEEYIDNAFKKSKSTQDNNLQGKMDTSF